MNDHDDPSIDSTLWPRRRFLRQTVLTAGAAAALGVNSNAKAAAQPIIDAHIHFYDPNRPGGIHWPPRDSAIFGPHLPEQFGVMTQGMGVAGAVVIEAEAGLEDNRWMLELAKTSPIILGYIARLTPGTDGFAAEFERYLESPVFRGLRLWPDMLARGADQAAFGADLRRVAEHGLMVDVVGGSALLPLLETIFKIAPGLKVVIDHLPFNEWDQNLAAMCQALKPAAARPKVFAKISNVPRRANGKLLTDPNSYRRRLDALWELFGEDRVIYGSNWPVSDFVAPYATGRQIVGNYLKALRPAAAEKFFWKNSLAAYHWQPRGAALHLQ